MAAAAALLAAALAPAGAAAAETRSFVKIGEEFPSGGNNLQFGPAPDYPSTIAVSGVPGTVTKVTVTVFALSSVSPDDIDMALVGPNGAQVMLMSDACGESPKELSQKTWTFDDAAATFLSDGPCPTAGIGSFKPSNYGNPELDDLSKEGGGPPPPYTNALADLTGGAADGSWNLFVLDDGPLTPGFFFNAWALTLEVEPPPPVGPSDTSPTATKKKTGKRARALAKCKAKPTKKARKRCRAKARKLPR